MSALISFLIFVCIVVGVACVVAYILEYLLSLLSVGIPTKLVRIIIGLVALLIILQRAVPLLEHYT